jgi:capsule polysaccharide export protein KpsE/RkpR
MAVTAMKAKNTVESLREIVQDLLVPDMKAIKVSIDSLRNELHIEVAAIRGEITSVRGEMAAGFDAVRTEMRLRDEKQTQAIQALSDKLGYAIDIRERLAVLEDRSARS